MEEKPHRPWMSYVWLAMVLVACALLGRAWQPRQPPPGPFVTPTVQASVVPGPRPVLKFDWSAAAYPRQTALAAAHADWHALLSVGGVHLGDSRSTVKTLLTRHPGCISLVEPTEGLRPVARFEGDTVDSIGLVPELDVTENGQTRPLLTGNMTGPQVQALFGVPKLPVFTGHMYERGGSWTPAVSVLTNDSTDVIIFWGGASNNDRLETVIVNWMTLQNRDREPL